MKGLQQRDSPNVGFFETSNEAQFEIQSWIRRNGRIGGRFSLLGISSDVDGVTLDPGKMHDLVGRTQVDWRDGIRRMVEARNPELLRTED